MNLDAVKELVEDIEQEVDIIKSTLQTVTSEGDSFVPMVIFYKNPTTKLLVVAPNSDGEIQDKLMAIAETLHLFTALPASSAIVTLESKVSCDDEIYSALNLFVISEPSATMLQFPYRIENNTVTWFEQYNQCQPIDDVDMDEVGKDIATMLFYFVNLQHNFFSAPEILSYLSKTGAAIGQINTKIEYFNFAAEEVSM